MPRKSLRTSTTMYRRRRLTWDDSESCTFTLNNESGENISRAKTGNVRKMRSRLVTPSPKALNTSDRSEETESPQKGAPRRKQLFQKRKSSRNKDIKRREPRKDLPRVALKKTTSKKKSLRYQKRNFAAGDSLATFLSFKKTLKNSEENTIISAISKSDHPKCSQRHSNRAVENDERSGSTYNPQAASPPTTITTEDEDSESIERKKEPAEKKNKPIPPELMSLLTSRMKKRTRRTRARSTLEILDEFKKEKKELESRKSLRPSLPRACKRSTKSTDDDSAFESENNNDDDDDWTEDKAHPQMKNSQRNGDSRKKLTSINDPSTNKVSTDLEISPPITKLKPRPSKKRSPPSAFDKSQGLLQLAAPSLSNDDNASNDRGGRVRRQPERRNNTLQQAEAENSQVSLSLYSRRKRRRCIVSDTNDFDDSNSGVRKSNIATRERLSPRQNSRQTLEKSSNSSVMRRGSQQQMMSQSYLNSPTKLVSVSNGESRTCESPTRATTQDLVVASPRRRNGRQSPKQRKSDNDGSISGKRVRFDSSTTTFSVKIKIKTNLDTSSQDRNRSDYSQSIPCSPSLDQSAVQAIANQVTQACLTQARASTGRGNNSIVRTCGDSIVNVDVDVNENDDFSTSSNSDQCNEPKDKTGDRKQENSFLHDMNRKRNASIFDTREEESSLLQKDFDDWRSVTSELTSDWNRPKPPMFNGQNYFEKGRQHQRFPWGNKDSIPSTFNHHGEEASAFNAMKPPPAVPKPKRYGEIRSQSSMCRRQRIRSCGDSLAESGFGSISSAVELDTTTKIPREVSLRKPSSASASLRSPRNKIDKVDYTSTISRARKPTSTEKNPNRMKDKELENNRVLPIVPGPSQNSYGKNICGKCKGCRRLFDCQTCDVCLEKLHSFGSLGLPSTVNGQNLCLERRCQRAYRIGFVDSLLGADSSVNRLQSIEPREKLKARKDQTRNAIKTLTYTKTNDAQETDENASKTMKAPWEDGDDWTVDYSYLSEPEYRRHWGMLLKPSSSTRSLSTPSRRSSVYKKQRIASGGRTSVSSVSESMVSQQQLKTRTIPSLSVPNNQQIKGRKRRSGKRKRDPSHGIALPRTSKDACSVTSWRENRKCLRALMEYDEADQDWV